MEYLQTPEAGGTETSSPEVTYETLNRLVSDVQVSLEQNKKTLAEVNKLAGTVKKQTQEIGRQNQDIADQRETNRGTQAIVMLGFILALVTLIAVVITDWTFQRDSMKQTTDQTTLLQEIKNK